MAMSESEIFALKPAYDRRIHVGLHTWILIASVLLVGVIVFWSTFYGRYTLQYLSEIVFPMLAIALAFFVFVSWLSGKKDELAGIISATANEISSWACVGPIMETFGYEADIEFKNGCYVRCSFSPIGSSFFRVYKFIQGPESVLAAPLIKARADGKTFRETRFPARQAGFQEWMNSETGWKKSVGNDESICNWLEDHYFFGDYYGGPRSGPRGRPGPGDVYGMTILCQNIYLRSPKREGEWLKGKTLGIIVGFHEPNDQQQVKAFYDGLISTADKIIEYIKSQINLS
jgi:hypothetical protein